MIRLVASDIDGTIISDANHISSENMRAMKDMENLQISFTICTRKDLFNDEEFL